MVARSFWEKAFLRILRSASHSQGTGVEKLCFGAISKSSFSQEVPMGIFILRKDNRMKAPPSRSWVLRELKSLEIALSLAQTLRNKLAGYYPGINCLFYNSALLACDQLPNIVSKELFFTATYTQCWPKPRGIFGTHHLVRANSFGARAARMPAKSAKSLRNSEDILLE